MFSTRHEARIVAVQLLYQRDMSGLDAEDLEKLIADWLEPEVTVLWLADEPDQKYVKKRLDPKMSKLIREYGAQLVLGTLAHLTEIDQIIREKSEHWNLDRMLMVDRNILRLGLYEMLFGIPMPPKVVINEAIELSKEMADEDAWRLVNGILDAVRIERLPDAPAALPSGETDSVN